MSRTIASLRRLCSYILITLSTITFAQLRTSAAPTGSFTSIQPVTEANQSMWEWVPVVSYDGRELFFSSGPAFPRLEIYRATRNSATESFGDSTWLADLGSPTEDDVMDISPDGLTLYFVSDGRTDTIGSFDLFSVTRPSLNEPFGNVASLGADLNSEYDDGGARVSTDGLSMVFHSLRPGQGFYDLYTASRSSASELFGNVEPLTEINTPGDEFGPHLSSDGLTLFYSDFTNAQRDNGVGYIDIWVASRENTEQPFGEPVNLNEYSLGSEVNSDLGETLPYLTRDWPANGAKMYFIRGTASDGTDVYEATWVTLPGDFDGDGSLTAADIDALSAEVRAGTNRLSLDLTDDGLVNDTDRTHWIEQLKRTYLGDTNLDGEFNSLDLVEVLSAGQYEDSMVGNSDWADGDWSGDSEFDSSDLVAALGDGGYQIGPRAIIAVVPEPAAITLVVIAVMMSTVQRRFVSL